ncbi:MAG: hypothetical protein HOV94_16610 [Saccharothrix sp.]|nr:hypothetical protein [Saccharothrix sp.]
MRGLLRAAALLAVGTSPLLASAASASEAPTEILDGRLGSAPELGVDAARPVTDLLDGRPVKLPAPLPGGTSDIQVPHIAAPAELDLPAAPAPLPRVEELLSPQNRSLPETPQLPLVASPLSGPQEMPDLAGQLGKLPLPSPLG